MLMRTNNCGYLSIDLVRPAAETIENKKKIVCLVVFESTRYFKRDIYTKYNRNIECRIFLTFKN